MTRSLRSLAVLWLLIGPGLHVTHGNQVVWFSRVGSSHQTSGGAAIDGSYLFELGAFTPGFTPTAGNTATWAATWNPVSRSAFQTTTQVFGGDHVVTSNESPFLKTNRAYIWGFSLLAPTEWILIGDPDWLWPDATDQIAFPEQWTVATASQVIVGAVDPNEVSYFLRMGNVASGSLPIVDATTWLATNFNPGQLVDPEISGWEADPDLDGLSNLCEMAAGTAPLTANLFTTPATVIQAGSQEFLQMDVARESSALLDYVVEVSFDRVNWNSSAAFAQVVLDTPSQLVVRSSIPLGVLDRQFMRLVVGLPQ